MRRFSLYCWSLLLGMLLPMGAVAQGPLTLREAIQQALGESPEVKAAVAGSLEAKANASLARTQLLPQVTFTEDISRGNDPVYVFGSKLRQQRFTITDFDLGSHDAGDVAANYQGAIY